MRANHGLMKTSCPLQVMVGLIPPLILPPESSLPSTDPLVKSSIQRPQLRSPGDERKRASTSHTTSTPRARFLERELNRFLILLILLLLKLSATAMFTNTHRTHTVFTAHTHTVSAAHTHTVSTAHAHTVSVHIRNSLVASDRGGVLGHVREFSFAL